MGPMKNLPQAMADLRRSHTGFTQSIEREHAYEPLRVEGTLPPALRGTLVRNGPGLYELFDRPYSHAFEADGALLGVRFDGGQAQAAHKVIQSQALKEERARGKPLYGTNAALHSRLWRGLQLRAKNPANTSVTLWQGRLFALFEAGLPTEISLDDLSTLGTTRLDGLLDRMLSAHPHRVPSRRATYNFGQRLGKQTFVDIFKFPDEGAASRIASFPIPHTAMLHDFIATDTHMVFFVAPLWMSLPRAMLRIGTFRDFFRWAPQDGTEVVVVPFDRPDEVVRFHTDTFFTWHFANAYNQDDQLVVDFVRYTDVASLDAISQPGAPVSGGTLSRVRLSPGRRGISGAEPLCALPCEFPMIDQNRAGTNVDAIWITSDDARCCVARVNPRSGETRAWQLDEGHRPSEAVLVAAPQGPGWALTLVYDANRHQSYVAVLDAEHPEAGPVAKAFIGHPVPITFHGIFVPPAAATPAAP